MEVFFIILETQKSFIEMIGDFDPFAQQEESQLNSSDEDENDDVVSGIFSYCLILHNITVTIYCDSTLNQSAEENYNTCLHIQNN